MEGVINRYDPERGFGLISVEGTGKNLFFHMNQITSWDVRCIVGERVEFEQSSGPGRPQANKIRRPPGYVMPSRLAAKVHPSEELFRYCAIQLDDIIDDSGTKREGVLHALKKTALEEDWVYDAVADPVRPFPILRNYLVNTFYKLAVDGFVKEVKYDNEQWAAFNTGLVDTRYESIYCLLKKNDRPPRHWKFYAFCRANIGREGQTLVELFNPLPRAAKYFEKPNEVIFDPDFEIFPRYDHIVYDGIERDRYPIEFLRRYVPLVLDWIDPSTLDDDARFKYLKQFRQKLEADTATDVSIRRRIDDAIALAKKRARWNFKTAIPLYYPRDKVISLLLPIALVNDDKVDLALVVNLTRAQTSYSAETVYKLKWAYEHARLVCRPLSDWLTPEAAKDEREDSIEDVESNEPASISEEAAGERETASTEHSNEHQSTDALEVPETTGEPLEDSALISSEVKVVSERTTRSPRKKFLGIF